MVEGAKCLLHEPTVLSVLTGGHTAALVSGSAFLPRVGKAKAKKGCNIAKGMIATAAKAAM